MFLGKAGGLSLKAVLIVAGVLAVGVVGGSIALLHFLNFSGGSAFTSALSSAFGGQWTLLTNESFVATFSGDTVTIRYLNGTTATVGQGQFMNSVPATPGSFAAGAIYYPGYAREVDVYVATDGKGDYAYFARVVLVNNATVTGQILPMMTSSLVNSTGNTKWSVYALSPYSGEIDMANPGEPALGIIGLDFKGLTVTYSGLVKLAQDVAGSV
jgi:hypothetical protein